MTPVKILTIIQSRLTSTRYPKKVLSALKGCSLISRVCSAARDSILTDKVVVAWAHKFPHLDENDVLGRFKELITKYDPEIVVRLTADCPLITSHDIDRTISEFILSKDEYKYSGRDGYDVQVFYPRMLDLWGHKEHVIVPPKRSVDTPGDLECLKHI